MLRARPVNVMDLVHSLVAVALFFCVLRRARAQDNLCPDGTWTHATWDYPGDDDSSQGSYCYKSFNYMYSWNDAQAHCRTQTDAFGTPANLATIHSHAENGFVNGLSGSNTAEWIGATRQYPVQNNYEGGHFHGGSNSNQQGWLGSDGSRAVGIASQLVAELTNNGYPEDWAPDDMDVFQYWDPSFNFNFASNAADCGYAMTFWVPTLCDTAFEVVSSFTCKVPAYAPAGHYLASEGAIRGEWGYYYDAQACPVGRYRSTPNNDGSNAYDVNIDCLPCPAGSYGEDEAMTTAECTGPCLPGYYCLAGSSSSTAAPCAAGYYGVSGSHTSPFCSGPCTAGYYCEEGTTEPITKCEAGHYGASGQSFPECSGECSAGYYCESGSVSSTQNMCGSGKFYPAAWYCPQGSGEPLPVSAGHYTMCVDGSTDTADPHAAATRSDQEPALRGNFAVQGELHPCPIGRYGSSTGLDSNLCSGPCRAGYYCPEGSEQQDEENCAPPGSDDDEGQRYYCAEGALQRLIATDTDVDAGIVGEYTGVLDENGLCVQANDEDPRPKNRECKMDCPDGKLCVNGQLLQEFEWMSFQGMKCHCNHGMCIANKYSDEVTDQQSSNPDFNWRAFVVGGFKARYFDPDAQEMTFVEDFEFGTFAVSNQCKDDPYRENPFYITAENYLTLKDLDGHANGFNHEECAMYIFEIHAQYLGQSQTCFVRLSPRDENDIPYFDPPLDNEGYLSLDGWTVDERSSRNTVIGEPDFAKDKDVGQGLSYTIIGGNDDDMFWMRECNGQLYVNKDLETNGEELDAAVQDTYDLEIEINDDPNNFGSSETISGTIRVNVVNINDPPLLNTTHPGSCIVQDTEYIRCFTVEEGMVRMDVQRSQY